jgi:hypothetical protein
MASPNNGSRLQTNSESIRNNLVSRNLYTPDNIYPIDSNTSTKIINTISKISSTLSPFRSIDLKNSVIGRLTTKGSPISEIGLICLGNQLANNAASKLSKDYLPTINIGNLFDKSVGTKLFTKKKNFNITKNIFGSQSGLLSIGKKVLNITEGYYPNNSPFPKNVTNKELLDNTGSGIIEIRNSNLNRNLYQSNFNKTSFNFLSIDQRNNKNYKFFDTLYNNNFTDSETANNNLSISYSKLNKGDEYGDVTYMSNQIGKTTLNFKNYDSLNNFPNDGKSEYGKSNNPDYNKNNWIFGHQNLDLHWDHLTPNDSLTNYGNIGGLVEFTRNIMVASKGKYISINKKIYKHNEGTYGFNGSAMFEAPSTALEDFKDKRGLRQHTFKDQYNNFSKAIRYSGNKNYVGNKDSVIYETVSPRIHPPINTKGKDDNKNIMFSIENLAFQVNLNDKKTHGVIINSDDNLTIPLSEVGAFGGRIMWFPPYDLTIVETSDAKSTSTVFLGRNEPIYNYENTERSATITFKLLADYPSNLHDFKGKSQKEIIEFFTYGGKPQENIITNINTNGSDITTTKSSIDQKIFEVFFPNDEPKLNSDVETIIQRIIDIGYGITNGDINQHSFLSSIYDVYNYIESDTLNDILEKCVNYDVEIEINGYSSKLYTDSYNKELSLRRCNAVKYLIQQRAKLKNINIDDNNFKLIPHGSTEAKESTNTVENVSTLDSINSRFVRVYIRTYKKNSLLKQVTSPTNTTLNNVEVDSIYEKSFTSNYDTLPIDTNPSVEYQSIKDNYYMPVFHSQTPEDYHRRLTFLQQCTRQGAAQKSKDSKNNISNSVFGRQPICILRIGDFFYTKIIINSINFNYKDGIWDMNPEGFGLQPLMCDVTLNIKLIGGQSLKGPIDILQNAIGFNYYANSTFTDKGIYQIPNKALEKQETIRTKK